VSGTTVRVISRRRATFVGASGNPIQKLILARRIDVSQYTDFSFALRFHEGTLAGTGANMSVMVYREAPSDEDPATDFIYFNQTLGATGAIPNPAPGGYHPINPVNTTSFGAFVCVVAEVMIPNAGETTTLVWSIDLTLKARS